MVEGILAAGHVAVGAAEGTGRKGRVQVEGIGADLDLDLFFPHGLKDSVSVFHVDAERLIGVPCPGCCGRDGYIRAACQKGHIILGQGPSASQEFLNFLHLPEAHRSQDIAQLVVGADADEIVPWKAGRP